MRQGMIGFLDAVASAGPYANNLHLAQTDNHINISSLNVYRPDALPDAQPTVSRHGKHRSSPVNLQKTDYQY